MKNKCKQLVASLIFPILIIILSIILFFVFIYSSWSEVDIGSQIIVLCPLLGGIVSALITMILKVDTSQYTKHRINMFIVNIILCALSWILLFLFFIEILILFVPILLCIFEYIYLFDKAKRIREIIVLFFSDPLIYYLIIIIVFIIDFSNSQLFSNFHS